VAPRLPTSCWLHSLHQQWQQQQQQQQRQQQQQQRSPKRGLLSEGHLPARPERRAQVMEVKEGGEGREAGQLPALKRDGLDAARMALPGGGVVASTQAKVDGMKDYVKRSGCAKVLEELYQAVMAEKPKDPVVFLIDLLERRQ